MKTKSDTEKGKDRLQITPKSVADAVNSMMSKPNKKANFKSFCTHVDMVDLIYNMLKYSDLGYIQYIDISETAQELATLKHEEHLRDLEEKKNEIEKQIQEIKRIEKKK
ncbi:MAG: hypothetical protein H6540_04640 [Bacteroidales bacterium]|nr:hypothetical protein [Bacteroidales bacterium]